MELFSLILCGCLCVLCGVLAAKYLLLRRQLRCFAKETARLTEANYRQPIKVDSFDADVVALANALNAHIALQKALAADYRADRRELSNIVSGISHDFRTPLTAAMGYLQLLEKDGELSAQKQEYLSVVMDKTGYLKQLSDDFFEISTPEGDDTPPEKAPVNFSNLLSEVLLEQYDWILQRELKTQFSIAEGIFIESDPHLLRRILDNLFSNARKYAISVLAVTLTPETNGIMLQVCNDAADAETLLLSQLFQPFYRGTARCKTGSGLGLYVVKRLADRLGLTIDARLDEKKQFVITLWLPPKKDG